MKFLIILSLALTASAMPRNNPGDTETQTCQVPTEPILVTVQVMVPGLARIMKEKGFEDAAQFLITNEKEVYCHPILRGIIYPRGDPTDDAGNYLLNKLKYCDVINVPWNTIHIKIIQVLC